MSGVPATDECDKSIPTGDHDTARHLESLSEEKEKESVDVKFWVKNYKQQRSGGTSNLREDPTQLKDEKAKSPSKTSDIVQEERDAHNQGHEDNEKTNTGKDRQDKDKQAENETKGELNKEKPEAKAEAVIDMWKVRPHNFSTKS